QIGDGWRGKGRLGLHPFIDQVSARKVHEPDLSTFQHYKNGFTIFRSGWGEHRDLKMNRTLSSAMVMTFADIRIMIAEVSTSIQLVAVGARMVVFTATNNAIRIGSIPSLD